jgi:hypothetical protein
MQQDIRKYKVVRRGQKYCVRVQGVINTQKAQQWCMERNINGLGKSKYGIPYTWESWVKYDQRWDYDFFFDKPTDATAFILGYL